MRNRVTLAAALLASGCSMAPAYRPPQIAAPPAFKETPGWSAATPMDATPRGQWWKVFGDPVLDDLVARGEAASPTLAAALARYDQARAIARDAQSDLAPQVDLSGEIARERVSANRPIAIGGAQTYRVATIGASLGWEVDLWGRIRDSVRAARADAQASAGDLAAARLSLGTQIADAYLRLRGLDAQQRLLQRSVAAFDRAFRLTDTRHEGGIASGIDVSRARSQLSSARAQISAVANDRAAAEHELAALVGAVASDFTIAPADALPRAPRLPSGAPSELLQRRPDVAAAERRMFAANARIGAARAAFFPSLTLGASGGFQAARGDLLSTPSSFWALGPIQSILTVFDGGRRRAQLDLSRAQYDEVAAGYRDTALTAFRQVEDAIAATRLLDVQARDQRDAATAANRTSDLAFTRYRDGASDYLDVVTAQTDALVADRALLSLETDRARAAVALVRALGGEAEPTG